MNLETTACKCFRNRKKYKPMVIHDRKRFDSLIQLMIKALWHHQYSNFSRNEPCISSFFRKSML